MRPTLLASIGMTTLLAACGSDPPTATPVDAGTDVPAVDVPAVDVQTADVQTRDVPRVSADVAPPTECNDVEIEELSALGELEGEVTRYTGNNREARNSATAGIQVPAAFAAQCNYRTTYQRVFRYVMRRAGSLRISTANAGTATTFDSTLVAVAMRTCVAAPRDLFCNDDDPTATAASRNRFASRLGTAVFPAGATVLIGVGGLAVTTPVAGRSALGIFELSVEEVPAVAEGGRCDRRLLVGACGAGLNCVGASPGAAEGTCRREGSIPGAACVNEGCAAGLTCDATTGTCFRTVAVDMPCEATAGAWNRCNPDASCVAQPGGVGLCRARGTVANSACTPANSCTGEGLGCDPSTATCRVTVARDGDCNLTDSLCPTGQICHFVHGAQSVGRCANAASLPGMTCAGTCTAGLTCNTGVSPARCFGAAVAAGEVCTAFVPCATGNVCFLTDPTDRTRGRCYADGASGGRCRSTGAPCNTGLACTSATPASGRCVRVATTGESCELYPAGVTCGTGTVCARTEGSALVGTCVAEGTAAGAACRTTGTRCDGMLRCSTATGAGVCQGDGAMGACDPRTLALGCATGQVCHATGFNTGRCAMTVAEAEPNDRVGLAQSLSAASTSVRLTLGSGDVDCVSVEAIEGGRLVARAVGVNGTCPSSTLTLDLFDPGGRLLTTVNANGAGNCPIIDGTLPDSPAFSVARGLRAGRYVVCERSATSVDVGENVLDVDVTAAP